jgi:hypothetical protein
MAGLKIFFNGRPCMNSIKTQGSATREIASQMTEHLLTGKTAIYNDTIK